MVPNISFVVIAYNEDHHIAQCLESIERLDGIGEHEVIVVDDGSTDTTACLVDEFAMSHPSVTLISQENQGRGAARATGLAATTMDLVVMVDGDLELPRDWLVRCLQEMTDDIDVIGGVAVPEGDVSWLHAVFKLDPRPVPLEVGITGGNGLYRREAIVNIGFDAEMRTGEDIVFRHKLRDAGYSSKVLGDLLCIHREDKGYVGTLRWMVESGISATHQLRRFRPWRLPDYALIGWIVTSVIVGLVVSWWAGLMLAVGWVVLAGAAHVVQRFRVHAAPAYLARLAVAALVNSTVIGAYFVGRLIGFVTRNHIPRW